MEDSNIKSRRSFLQTSLLGAAGLSLLPSISFAALSPSDRIKVGVIGLGRRALQLTSNFLKIPGVQIVAGSDVYGIKRQRFEQQVKHFYGETKQKSKVETYGNYRDLLDRQDIDAVVIASPDHWHAMMAIDACKAGKEVYLEKPLTFTIKEGQELVKAVRQNNRILAVGSQQRSMPGFIHAVNLVREGKIGEIDRVDAFTGAAPPKPYDLPEEVVPQDLNWDLWLGPSPYVHYNHQLNPPISLDPVENEKIWGAWRWYKELGGGLTTDWGAHMFDIVQWAIGKGNSGPEEIIPAGYQNYEFLTYHYGNGVTMTDRPWDKQKSRGVKFWGSNGWIEVTRDFIRTSEPGAAMETVKDTTGIAHEMNFIEAIRSHQEPLVPVEAGHRTNTVCILGNIAHDLKRPVTWDPRRQAFVEDAQAATYLHRPYRDGYSLS